LEGVEEALPQLLRCILAVISGSSDTDGFPTEACANALFYSSITSAEYPRMAGRKIFEELFLKPRRPERLQLAFDVFAEGYREGILFLLHTIGKWFPGDEEIAAVAVEVLAFCFPVVAELSPWVVDRLSYLRTASFFFASLPPDHQAVMQAHSELLMVQCNPSSADFDTVGYTIGVEALLQILEANGAPTDTQRKILHSFGAQTMGNIGLDTVAIVFPAQAAGIIAAATNQLSEFLRQLSITGYATHDAEVELDHRCQFLAAHIRRLPVINILPIVSLIPFVLRKHHGVEINLGVDLAPIAEVIAAALTKTTLPYGERIVQTFADADRTAWDAIEGRIAQIALCFICVHRRLPAAIGGVLEHLYDADWTELDDFELSMVVDLMCACVHLGFEDQEFIPAVLYHLAEVDKGDAAKVNAVIRWHATLFLAFGQELPQWCGEPWIEQVRAGWFSTPYLGLLTILTFSRFAGSGNEMLAACIEGLRAGQFQRPSEDDAGIFDQPEGMEALLARYAPA
jgi:hypothetical protein